MAQTTIIPIGSDWTAINTVEDMYLFQNRGNVVIEIQYSTQLPAAETASVELKPGEVMTHVLMIGLAFGRVKHGSGTISITE